MNIQNVSIFHNELISCGLLISGCSSDGAVHISERPTAPLIDGEPDPNWVDPTDSIIALALAAHGQPLSSDECVALQAALTEEQWLAYIEARKAPIRAMRAERYKSETDALFLKCFEDATVVEDGDYYNCKVAKTDFDGWKAAKQIIREELPYPS